MATPIAEPVTDAISEHLVGRDVARASEVVELIQGFATIASLLEEAIRGLQGQADERDGVSAQTSANLEDMARTARALYRQADEARDAFFRDHQFWLSGWDEND